MSRTSSISALCIAVVVSSGCGGLSYTVDRDLLSEVSIEQKLLLFDAENEVSIAIDEYEQIAREIHDHNEELAEADANLNDFKGDIKRASAKGDTKAAEVAEMARQVELKRITYLEAIVGLLRERLRAQERVVTVADAKFELAKAKLVKKSNVRGASDIDLAKFEGQVDGLVEKARDARSDLTESEGLVTSAKGEWLKARDELRKASGGGVGSPWTESGGDWEGW